MKNEHLLSFVVGFIGLMFGTDKEVLRIVTALAIAIGFDTATGALKAFKNKTLTSRQWNTGMMRKILMLLCVSFAYFMDTYKIINVGISLESATASFFIVGEVVSILENFIDLGLKLPKPFIEYLAKNPINKED